MLAQFGLKSSLSNTNQDQLNLLVFVLNAMVLSDEQYAKIEKYLEELKKTYDDVDVGSQVLKDLGMRFEFEHPIDWYYGLVVGRLWGHAEEAAINLKGGILDDEEINQINGMIKSLGQEIKETITRMKLA